MDTPIEPPLERRDDPHERRCRGLVTLHPEHAKAHVARAVAAKGHLGTADDSSREPGARARVRRERAGLPGAGRASTPLRRPDGEDAWVRTRQLHVEPATLGRPKRAFRMRTGRLGGLAIPGTGQYEYERRSNRKRER